MSQSALVVTILTRETVCTDLEAGEKAGEVFLWDSLVAGPGMYSVPAWYAEHLAELRQELMAFMYELGWASLSGGEVQEQLKAGDTLSMWWCSLLFEKHPKVTPGVYPALKLRALERMLEEKMPECRALVLHGGDEKLVRSLREFCAITGRTFRHVPALGTVAEEGGLKEKLRRCYYSLPGLLKAIVRFGWWLWSVRRHLPHTKTQRPREFCGTIATYFPNVDAAAAKEGVFRSRYWESLHDMLRQAFPPVEETDGKEKAREAGQAVEPTGEGCPPVHWLFIHFPSPQYSFRHCLALRDLFREKKRDGLTFHYLEEFLTFADIKQAVRRYLRLARASRRMEEEVRPLFHLGQSRMPLWQYLGDYWRDSFEGWRCLERCLQRRAMLSYSKWAGRQRWTLFPMENCPWERMLTEALRKEGHGPVYGTQHSTVRPTDFRYFDDARSFRDAEGTRFQPDLMCGNGQGACKEMLLAGMPPERISMVEALRYMYLSKAMPQGDQSAPACQPTVELGLGRILLVVTSFFADEVEAHLRTLGQWLREAPDAMHWQVRVKPHPYLAVEPYIQRHLPAEQHIEVLGTPIAEVLEEAVRGACTVVWASNSTTVALEAALMGLPVMVQLPEDDVDLCPLQNVPGVARVATAGEVREALTKAQKAKLEHDYLALDPALPRWRKLLGLR